MENVGVMSGFGFGGVATDWTGTSLTQILLSVTEEDRCEQYTRAASALELQALPLQDITKLLLGKEHSLLSAPLLGLLSVY